MIIGIYKITSPSNRIYVGQSTNIDYRWKQYKYFYKWLYDNSLIYKSIEKYGVSNHKFEILEECSVDKLSQRELFWIEELKSNYRKYPNNKGLNLHEGGNSPPSRIKGTKMPKEFGLKISEKQKENYKKNPNMGTKGKRTKKAKIILDKNSNKKYHGLKEASIDLEIGITTVTRWIKKGKLEVINE